MAHHNLIVIGIAALALAGAPWEPEKEQRALTVSPDELKSIIKLETLELKSNIESKLARMQIDVDWLNDEARIAAAQRIASRWTGLDAKSHQFVPCNTPYGPFALAVAELKESESDVLLTLTVGNATGVMYRRFGVELRVDGEVSELDKKLRKSEGDDLYEMRSFAYRVDKTIGAGESITVTLRVAKCALTNFDLFFARVVPSEIAFSPNADNSDSN